MIIPQKASKDSTQNHPQFLGSDSHTQKEMAPQPNRPLIKWQQMCLMIINRGREPDSITEITHPFDIYNTQGDMRETPHHEPYGMGIVAIIVKMQNMTARSYTLLDRVSRMLRVTQQDASLTYCRNEPLPSY